MDKSDWLNIDDFAKACGLTVVSIRWRLKNGHIKLFEKRHIPGVGTGLFFSPTEVRNKITGGHPRLSESHASPKGGMYSTPLFKKEIELPDDAPEDLDLSLLENFVVEKGRYSFKQFVVAVDMALKRKPWEEIEKVTGMNKPTVTAFIQELKDARAAEPARFPTIMSYLTAGRPYLKTKRDMLKKINK